MLQEAFQNRSLTTAKSYPKSSATDVVVGKEREGGLKGPKPWLSGDALSHVESVSGGAALHFLKGIGCSHCALRFH